MYLMIINSIGMLTSCIQKIIVYRTKDNVTLNTGQIFLELSIAAVGLLYIVIFSNDVTNLLISDTCGEYMEISDVDKMYVDKVYALLNQ